MNKQWISLLFVLSSLQLSYATIGKYDLYISYCEQLHFRAGINYEWCGIFVRPIFNKQSHSYYSETDEIIISSLNQKGAELGVNLNRVLFSYKKSEMILNFSGGFIVSHVIMTGNKKYWEKAGSIAIQPEIRLFKKASITLTPLYYRYNFPIKSINKGANGTLYYLDMQLMQMSFGLKFYY